ncbi:MAG: hypothetical protein Q4E26_01710, partial [Prevotellaceae bacterium]|nr:hypothetical protein [Prevotellaceae bacterium]
MKKPFYLVGLAALALVGCSDNDFFGTGNSPESPQEGNGAVSFFIKDSKTTRTDITGKDAAKLLSNQFVVWGEKNEEGAGTAAAEGNLVFKNYKVVYQEGTANTTESNSSNWEYVGETPYDADKVTPNADNQTIKYWDYSAKDYVYNAFSVLPEDLENGRVSVIKTEGVTSPKTKYDKGYQLTINEGADLEHIYFADRTPIGDKNNHPTNPPSSTVTNKIGDIVPREFTFGYAIT